MTCISEQKHYVQLNKLNDNECQVSTVYNRTTKTQGARVFKQV
jgi:hypothetical protein